MHRNSTNNGLIVTAGHVHASSSTDTFGFGYGRTMALMVRYDTRVRIHASYGCTIKIGYEEATVTGAGFFHGGVSLKPEADCSVGSYIDIIPEDWRLLSSGKKRLVFDHTCGIIPLCASPPPHVPEPATPPQLPAPTSPPSPRPSPPPFPPGTINLPPFAPRIASPPSPSLPPGAIVPISATSIVFGLSGVLVLGMFGLVSYVVCCLRRQVRQAVASAIATRGATGMANGNAPPATGMHMARIGKDGKSSIVHGVLVGAAQQPHEGQGGKRRSASERQALLEGVTGF